MILMISKLPPPIGGVTVHVKRLVQKLKERDDFQVDVLDYSRLKNPLKFIIKISNAKLIHIHLSNKLFRFLLVLLLRLVNKKIVVTFHGKYDFQNIMDRIVLGTSTFSLVLNEFTYMHAIKFNCKVKLIGAFIPPIEKDLIALDAEIENNIKNIQNRDYTSVFCTNASSYVLDKNGNEIYLGTELLKFFDSNQNYALIFSDPSGSYTKYFKKKHLKVPENVYIINRPHDFINIIKLSDALIRATTMDGDSLSIKEALFYKKPVLATDVVDRPADVILFSNFENLKSKIENIEEFNVLNSVKDSSSDIIKLYQVLLVK